MFVHFPVALILAALLLDTAGMALKNEKLRDAAYRVLCLATLGAAAAVATGFYAHGQIKYMPDKLHDLIELHETLGLAVLATAFTATALRIYAEKKGEVAAFVKQLSFAFLLVAGLLVAATGNLGGKIVYDYGTGTKLYDDKYKNAPLNNKNPDNKNQATDSTDQNNQQPPPDWH